MCSRAQITEQEVRLCIRGSWKRISAARWNTAWSCSAGNGTLALSVCWRHWVLCGTASFAARWAGNITDAVLASTLKGLIANGIVERKSYDEIPPRVEYSLTEKGASVAPILQSICQWAGVFYKDEGDTPMIQCRKCDHR